MNAVGLAEQESGRALGFFCTSCGRSQLPMHCQNPLTVEALTELHRKAEACCTTSVCEKHDYQLYSWALCPLCVAEGPKTDSESAQNYTEPMQRLRRETREQFVAAVLDDGSIPRTAAELKNPKAIPQPAKTAKRSRKAAAK